MPKFELPVPIQGRSTTTETAPYVGTSNRNRKGENNFASRDQEFQERATPENNHDENQAVGLQVISVFFSNAEKRLNPFPTMPKIITVQCFLR